MLKKLIHTLKLQPIPRAPGVTGRVVSLSLLARFFDELLGGLPDLLLPTIRDWLGLSYTEASLLWQILDYVAAVVEPINGLLIDIWQRKWLMGAGAIFIGLAIMVMGAAPTFLVLALGFVLFGLGSGPLAHTADVVLVEAHPDAPGRIYARSTLIDYAGALLPALLVALAFWLALSWRWLLAAAGAAGLLYAAFILRTRFPRATASQDDKGEEKSAWQKIRDNLGTVLRDRAALTWLGLLLLLDLVELPFTLQNLWLADAVGMSQLLISIYKGVELATGFVALLVLDRWLGRSSHRLILLFSAGLVLLLIPLWLFIPGIVTRFVIGVPLSFFWAMLWPILKGQSLASVPGMAGTIVAINALFGLLPLRVLYGWLADNIGLTASMLYVSVPAVLLMLLLIWRLPTSSRDGLSTQ